MNFTKKLLLFSMVFILLIVIPAVLADGEKLNVALVRYEPLPAAPGQYVTVHIELTNSGNDDANYAALEIVDEFPFSSGSEELAVETIGILKSQQSYIADFRLHVDSNAVVGTNKLKVKFTPDVNADKWQESELDIDVKSSDASISITSAKITPEKVLPGDQGDLELTLKNTAGIVLRNIAVKLNLVIQGTTSVIDIPFIPVDSTTEQRVSILKSGEITSMVFSLKAYPGATPGYYKVPVSLTFYDDQGQLNEMEDVIGVIISAAPELKITAEHIKTNEETNSKVRLKCINKGINDIKFLDIKVQDTDVYAVTGLSEDYIGDLDSDDYRTSEFNIMTSSQDKDTISLTATFKDENNKIYTQNLQVPVVYQHNVSNGNGSSNIVTFVLIIALLVMIIYIVKLRKKVKK